MEADNATTCSTLLSEPRPATSTNLQLYTNQILLGAIAFIVSLPASFATESHFCQVFGTLIITLIDMTIKFVIMTKAYLQSFATLTLLIADLANRTTTRREMMEADNATTCSTLLSEHSMHRM